MSSTSFLSLYRRARVARGRSVNFVWAFRLTFRYKRVWSELELWSDTKWRSLASLPSIEIPSCKVRCMWTEEGHFYAKKPSRETAILALRYSVVGWCTVMYFVAESGNCHLQMSFIWEQLSYSNSSYRQLLSPYIQPCVGIHPVRFEFLRLYYYKVWCVNF